MREPETPAILDAVALTQRLGVARSTIYRLMSDGALPPRVQLSARRFGWRTSDIDKWLAERLQHAA